MNTPDLSIDQLRYTRNQFVASNPVPLAGQLCIETDTDTAKVGDGTTAYLSLTSAQLNGDDRRSADDVWASSNIPAATSGTLVYRAILTQSGTDDPVEESVAINTIGPVIWTRDPGRLVIATFDSPLIAGKTNVQVTSGDGGGEYCLPIDAGVGFHGTAVFAMLDVFTTQDLSDDWKANVQITVDP